VGELLNGTARGMNKPVALEAEHPCLQELRKENLERPKESQCVFRTGSDSLKPKYDLGPFYMATFLSREELILG